MSSTSRKQLDDVLMIAWAQAPEPSGPAQIFNAAQLFLNRPEPLPGDFNADGIVDSNDFSIWQDGFASISNATRADGDGDGDGDVDGNDFLIWQSSFGSTTGGSAGSSPYHTAVPEPSTLALAVLLLCAVRRNRFF